MKYFKVVAIILTQLLSIGAFGQEELSLDSLISSEERCEDFIKKVKGDERKISAIDSMLSSRGLNSRALRSYLLVEMASALKMPEKSEYGMDTLKFLKDAEVILAYYDKAFELAICEQKNVVQYKRYDFLKSLLVDWRTQFSIPLTRRYVSDLNELKGFGLVPEKDGVGIGAFVFHGNDTWLGVEFSIFSSLMGSAKLRKLCGNNIIKVNLGNDFHLYNGLTFSYSRGLNTKANDISFSLIELHAPVVIVPAKFGLQLNANHSRNLYYLPTIGVGYKCFSINYSYKIIFKKSDRAANERSLFSIRFTCPVTNHRYKTRPL